MDVVQRRYDMDWLRVFGVLIVLPFHCMMIFIQQPWAVMYVKDTVEISSFIVSANIIHLFNMPLLFILAGMSAYYSLQKRSCKQYVKERVKKLCVPALFGCMILNPMMTYIYLKANHTSFSFWQHLVGFFTKNPEDFSGYGGGFTPAQFWFVIFLFVFSIVTVGVMKKCIEGKYNRVLALLVKFFYKPFTLSIMVLPIFLLSLTNILEDKNPLVYFVLFMLGYLLMTHEKYGQALKRDGWGYAILSVLLIVLNGGKTNDYEVGSQSWVIYKLVESAAQVIIVYAMLGLANRYLNKGTKLLMYLSKASFSIYVSHMLICTVVGSFVIKWPIPAGLKCLVIIGLTFGICLVLYEGIKRSQIASMLFGTKTEQRQSKALSM